MSTHFARLNQVTAELSGQTRVRASVDAIALRMSGVAAFVCDRGGVVSWANAAFTSLLGYDEGEFNDQYCDVFRSKPQANDPMTVLTGALAGQGHWGGDVYAAHKNGVVIPVHLMLHALDDNPKLYVGVVRDLSRTRSDEALITQLRYCDSLTGLPNWAWLQNELAQQLALGNADTLRLAVLLIDLNHFKAINDAVGEAIGDYLIATLAERLQASTVTGALVARRDGDEFCVVVPNAVAEDAERIGHAILQLVAEPIRLGQQQFDLSACVGISLYPTHGADANQLLNSAGTALHAAKRQTHTDLCIFSEHLAAEAQTRRRIEEGLRRAINQQELFLCYQPQVNLIDNKITGMEALLRWRTPTGEPIPPTDFIPIAEQTGLIIAIGEWVLREACKQGRIWRDAGYTDLRLAVNLSPCQFRQGNLIEMVCSVLDQTGFPADRLKLEITEGTLMEDPKRAEHVISSLRAEGVCFSVDDFGTGYSSLAYLKRFKLEQLKIDRSFVTECDVNWQDGAIIDSIIGLARNLALEVVAEGVESNAQLDFLRRQGCEQVQGYLYSRPLTADAFTQWLCEFNERHQHV